jgi:hypothetical protein
MYPKPKHMLVYELILATKPGNNFIKIPPIALQAATSAMPPRALKKRYSSSNLLAKNVGKLSSPQKV